MKLICIHLTFPMGEAKEELSAQNDAVIIKIPQTRVIFLDILPAEVNRMTPTTDSNTGTENNVC